jgi:hypothetical protein
LDEFLGAVEVVNLKIPIWLAPTRIAVGKTSRTPV